MERQQKAYKGVIDYFKKKILDGELRPGEKLPPERDIAERLNVSRNSVREAIRIMDMTGVISSQQGSGNYITCEFQKSLAETMTMTTQMPTPSIHTTRTTSMVTKPPRAAKP